MIHIILAVLSYIGAMLFVLWVFHHAVKAHPPAPQRPETDPGPAEDWPPDPIVSQVAGHIKDGMDRGVISLEGCYFTSAPDYTAECEICGASKPPEDCEICGPNRVRNSPVDNQH